MEETPEVTEEFFEAIHTFSEWQRFERERETETKQYRFVMFAMFFYAVIRVAAFVCATVIAVQGNIWLGAALFALSLFMRFEFKNTGVKQEKETP